MEAKKKDLEKVKKEGKVKHHPSGYLYCKECAKLREETGYGK